MASMIDTLRIAQSFKNAGFAPQQAELLAQTIAEASSQARDDLATKTDVEHLEARLGLQMKASLSDLKADTVRWLIGSQAVLLIALMALSTFSKMFS